MASVLCRVCLTSVERKHSMALFTGPTTLASYYVCQSGKMTVFPTIFAAHAGVL